MPTKFWHSFWKPLRTIEDAPLAVCDGSTVRESNLVATDLVKRTYMGETAFVLPSAAYRWYYMNKQQPDEVLLIKNFDSDLSCKARRK